MDNLIELYVAAGGTPTEDGLQVEVPMHLQPFDIVLRVVPTAIDMDEFGAEVTLRTFIPEDRIGINGALTYKEYDVEVKLPLKAIVLANG